MEKTVGFRSHHYTWIHERDIKASGTNAEGTMYLRGNGNQLTIKTVVQELNSNMEFPAKALLDSDAPGVQ